MAEAPSLRTSTRSIAANGIWFKSTTPPFRPCDETRRPLRRTRVAPAPCMRRLAEVAPLLPRWAPETTSAFDARLSRPLPLMFNSMSICSALPMPRCSISSGVIVSKGVAPSPSMRLISEPVTTKRSSFAVSSTFAVFAAGAVWASAMGSRLAAARTENQVAGFHRYRVFIGRVVGGPTALCRQH